MMADLDIDTTRSALIAADQDERRRILNDIPGQSSSELIALVANYLGDPAPAVSEAAVAALARCDHSLAAEAAVLHLRSSEPAERGYALEVLIRLGSQALPCLFHLLEDADHNLRKFAVDALAGIHAPESVPVLVQALESSDPIVAAAAAEALGTWNDQQSIHALVSAVRRGPDWVRISALSSLGKLGGEEAWQCICSIPSASSDPVKAAAVTAAGLVNSAEISETLFTQGCEFLAALLDPRKPALQGSILKTLRIWADLGGLPTSQLKRDFSPFREAIQDGLSSFDPEVRSSAVFCMGLLAPFDQQAFVTCLSDKLPSVQMAALKVLASHAVFTPDLLEKILVDKQQNEELRVYALHQFLNASQDHSSIDLSLQKTLVQLVCTAHEPELQAASLRVLLWQGAQESQELAVMLLAEEDFYQNDAALVDLMRCTTNQLLPIAFKGMANSDGEVRRRIFMTLVSVERALEFAQSTDGRALLITALGDDDWRIRIHAVSILENCPGQAWACQYVRKTCATGDERVRARAVHALGLLDGSPEGIRILEEHLKDTSEKVRAAAAQSLSRLSHSEHEVGLPSC